MTTTELLQSLIAINTGNTAKALLIVFVIYHGMDTLCLLNYNYADYTSRITG
jgi:type IV secretory pathway VirB2 component (pilin)